jgi:hypothetical protein
MLLADCLEISQGRDNRCDAALLGHQPGQRRAGGWTPATQGISGQLS